MRSGRIRLNTLVSADIPALCRRDAKIKDYALPMFEDDRRLIGLKLLRDDDDRRVWLRPVEDGNCFDICCKDFLRHCCGLTEADTGNYRAYYLPDKRMVVVDLKRPVGKGREAS